MVSEYGYATVASLELYTSEDYSEMVRKITDGEVDAKITAAEWLINTYLGQTYSGTIPDGVKFATHDIAKRLLYQWMREHGMKLDKEKVLEADKKLLNDDIKEILSVYKSSNNPIKLHHLYNNDPSVYY